MTGKILHIRLHCQGLENKNMDSVKKPSSIWKNLIFLYLRYILVILWIALMFFIVWFSSRPDYESTEQSIRIGKLVCHLIVNGYDDLTETAKYEYAAAIDHIVRKSAHFCEYAALGALTINASWLFFGYLRMKFKWKGSAYYPLIAAIAWCILFATSDEIHQLFVPGRFGSAADVMLDTIGAVVGIMIPTVILSAHRHAFPPSRKEDA